ncbi:hypothetical protein ENUP19_0149G0007 [Entamoeba nuttalli]|uniref:Uncharacterized protein n=2 Tax=Entamoeba nuttalli TaxID=412467 RepID=K2HZ28_ENTNP|nr:hypothetical protein ENU1_048210 [Entamoeba nuttalli P19]EKE41660.1 hypothetical protein ENU1_048210 [Entamoeba nuttalli P19]|eukprot:XP_008856002.1 hypothetical protein ENU1_048210 [Entamoeba nuttalli P19]
MTDLFQEKEIKFGFDSTTEDESMVNNKPMEDTNSHIEDLFPPEQSTMVYVESKFIPKEKRAKGLIEREKGYNKHRQNLKKKSEKKPRRPGLIQHETLQQQMKASKEFSDPAPVFNMPRDPRRLQEKEETTMENEEPKRRIILTNKIEREPLFNSETTADSSTNTIDNDLFTIEDDNDFFSSDFDLFSHPKKQHSESEVQLY